MRIENESYYDENENHVPVFEVVSADGALLDTFGNLEEAENFIESSAS